LYLEEHPAAAWDQAVAAVACGWSPVSWLGVVSTFPGRRLFGEISFDPPQKFPSRSTGLVFLADERIIINP
jgi:hypothetical protein